MQQVRWFDYNWRIMSVSGQFSLARKALDSLSTNPEALRAFIDPEVGHVILAGVVRQDLAVEELSGELQNFILRLDQNELVLTITLFETFMKDLHRIILRLAPTLLPENRQIPLGRLAARGFEAIIEEEIERRVSDLDRKSVPERARYFDQRLHVSWGPQELVDAAEDAVELRNRILHVEPDDPVSLEARTDAFYVAMFVPAFVCQAMVEHYPSALTQQDQINLEGRPFDRVYKAVQKKRG